MKILDLIIPSDQIINAFITTGIVSANVEYTIPEKGKVQKTFILSDKSVLHVAPILLNSIEPNNLISKWMDHKKGEKIYQVQSNALSVESNIIIPKISAYGKIRFDNNDFPYWIEQYIQGSLIAETKRIEYYSIYREIVLWSAKFHSQNIRKGESLAQFYISRLNTIINIISESDITSLLGDQTAKSLISFGEDFINNINTYIEHHECVTQIHGDLGGANILVNGDDPAVIDFEQGIPGGDWFNDIERLLLVEQRSDKTTEYKNSYIPQLSSAEKHNLIKQYADLRVSLGWIAPDFLNRYIENKNIAEMAGRIKLYRYDVFVSRIIRRYIFSLNEDKVNKGHSYEWITKYSETLTNKLENLYY
jgi:hypothetical protein